MAVVWMIDLFGDYQSTNSEPPPPPSAYFFLKIKAAFPGKAR
jgi:hypothetical protein